MADVSELQVMLADAAAGAQAHVGERRRQAIRDVVAQLLAAVPEADRILLALREMEGMSIEELAQVYHIGQSSVRSDCSGHASARSGRFSHVRRPPSFSPRHERPPTRRSVVPC
jgi:DNA-directed RNA polymerase specialized sigma24 family protein